MYVHTVNEKDTIFKIARQYAVQPTKILEDNGLTHDRLVRGQELLILTPTKYVTVRGSDTVRSIAKKFGIRPCQLVRNNPRLAAGKSLLPGQILSIKYDTPPMGTASLIGTVYEGCADSALKKTLPYLTYVIFKLTDSTDENEIRRRCLLVRDSGRVPLIEPMYEKSSGAYCGNGVMYMADKCDSLGGMGVCLDNRGKRNRDDALMALKKTLMERGGMLILRTNEPCANASSIADLTILGEGDGVPHTEYGKVDECSGAFLHLPTTATVRCEAEKYTITIAEAIRIAYTRGIMIEKQDGVCHYEFKRYDNGKGTLCKVSFLGLEEIKTRMADSATLGYLGAEVAVNTVPTSYLSMFNASFLRADYSPLPSGAI